MLPQSWMPNVRLRKGVDWLLNCEVVMPHALHAPWMQEKSLDLVDQGFLVFGGSSFRLEVFIYKASKRFVYSYRPSYVPLNGGSVFL